jgi:hypothetical protein
MSWNVIVMERGQVKLVECLRAVCKYLTCPQARESALWVLRDLRVQTFG